MFKQDVTADMLKGGVVISSLLNRACFSQWRGEFYKGTEVRFFLNDNFTHPNYKKGLEVVGMDKLTFVKWWWDVLQSWGVTDMQMEIDENENVAFIVKIHSSAIAPPLARLTLARYLQENPCHLFGMLELAKEYPDLFQGTPEKTWAAFCVSQHRSGCFFASRHGFVEDKQYECLDYSSTGHGILPTAHFTPNKFECFTALMQSKTANGINNFFKTDYALPCAQVNNREGVLKYAIPYYQELFNPKETKDDSNQPKFVAA